MDELTREVIEIISGVFTRPGVVITPTSMMGDPPDWDSLAFVEIFMAVSSHYGLDVSDDDAINFMSVPEIVEFVTANR